MSEHERSFARPYPEVAISPPDITENGLERTACMGRCPVYTVTLRRDGSAHYTGEMFAARSGSFTGTIDLESVDRLATLIIKNRFFEFRSLYSARATDLSSSITRVTLRGRVVRVRDEGMSSAPPALRAIEEAIDSAADGIVWRPASEIVQRP